MSISSEEFKKFLAKASRSTQARNVNLLTAKEGLTPRYVPPPLPKPYNAEDLQKAISLGIQPSSDEAKLNKTEASYLEWLKTLGDYWIGVQCITLKLGHDCRLTMDFAAVDKAGLRLIDTKATNRKTGKPLVEDDAWVKMRIAARLFPWIRFLVAHRIKTEWHHIVVKP